VQKGVLGQAQLQPYHYESLPTLTPLHITASHKEGEDSEEEVEHSRNSTQPSPAFKPHRVGGDKHE
ncbi:hypothetical protein NQZ68_014289, partial [Dissostichus eleginoides]